MSFEFPASATNNEVDSVMRDWWRKTSLQEHLKALPAFSLLADYCIVTPTSVCSVLFCCCFFFGPPRLLKQRWPELGAFYAF